MRALSCSVVLLAYLAIASTAHAGSAVLPPLKVDLGTIAMSDRQSERATGTALFIGINVATIYPKRIGFDVGIGYVGTFIPAEETHTHWSAEAGATTPSDRLVSSHGAYVDLSVLAHERPNLRTWVSGRTELLRSAGRSVMGIATRVSTELWSGIKVGGRGGLGVGVFALGLWAEMGVRQLAGGGLARQVSAGVSARVPLFLAGH